MTKQSSITRDQLARELYEHAVVLFGPARADGLRLSLKQRADHIWRVLTSAPETEDEPLQPSRGPGTADRSC